MTSASDGSPNAAAASDAILRLLGIMAALRTPQTGCPWDLEQTFLTIARYTIEEAYEVADAIERGDLVDLKEELGDLLLQVVFHARMAEEHGAFGFADVVEAIIRKLVRRHPHVFGDVRQRLAPEEVKALWGEIKQREKAERRDERARAGLAPDAIPGLLDGVPASLPALTRAMKLTAKAASIGFDWPDAGQVADKIREELGEVREAAAFCHADKIEEEIGDLIFAVANLARHHHVDPEIALRRANAKFERRFRSIEQALALDGRSLEASTLVEMEEIWLAVKREERSKDQ